MPLPLRPVPLVMQIGQAEWIERFVARLFGRDGGESRESLARLALQLWPRQALLPPERAADAEYAQWPAPSPAPRGDRAVTVDAADGVPEQAQGFSAGQAAPAKGTLRIAQPFGRVDRLPDARELSAEASGSSRDRPSHASPPLSPRC